MTLTFKTRLFALWCALFATLPLYPLPNGYPQPSALVVILLVLAIFSTGDWRPIVQRAARIITWLTLLLVWLTAVQLAWGLVLHRTDLLVPPLFYIYGGGVFWCALYLAVTSPALFRRYTSYAGTVVLCVLAVAALLLTHTDARVALSFNSPNQLGYFALLVATVVLITAPEDHMRFRVIATAASLWLAIASMSLAAIGAMGFLLMAAVFRWRVMRRIGLPVAAVAVLILCVLSFGKLQRDWHSKNLSDLDRGYGRILENPSYVAVGAGEGAYERFGGAPIEIHSSFGTVLFCYGVPGVLLFAALLFAVYRRAPVEHFVLSMPVFIYGLAHQGLRFTPFWLLLGTIAGLSIDLPEPTSSGPSARPRLPT